MNFGIVWQQIVRLNEQGKGKFEEAAGKLEALREGLKNGDVRVGEAIFGFTVAHYGVLSAEIQVPYQDLKEKLTGKAGQDVLVVKSTKSEDDDLVMRCHGGPEVIREGMFPEPKYYHVKVDLNLGRLASDSGLELDIREGIVGIKTGRHVHSGFEYPEIRSEIPLFGSVKWELVEKDIQRAYGDLPHLSENLKKAGPSELTMFCVSLGAHNFFGETKSAILVGDEVRNYFGKAEIGKEAYSRAVSLLDN